MAKHQPGTRTTADRDAEEKKNRHRGSHDFCRFQKTSSGAEGRRDGSGEWERERRVWRGISTRVQTVTSNWSDTRERLRQARWRENGGTSGEPVTTKHRQQRSRETGAKVENLSGGDPTLRDLSAEVGILLFPSKFHMRVSPLCAQTENKLAVSERQQRDSRHGDRQDFFHVKKSLVI